MQTVCTAGARGFEIIVLTVQHQRWAPMRRWSRARRYRLQPTPSVAAQDDSRPADLDQHRPDTTTPGRGLNPLNPQKSAQPVETPLPLLGVWLDAGSAITILTSSA